MDRPGTAMLWLALGVHRRSVLRLWSDTWFGAISPNFLCIAQGQESLAQPSLFDDGPALLAQGIMCIGRQRSRKE